MAIKVIHLGQIPDHTLRGTCRYCKTVIECQPADCKHNSDQRDGDYRTAACPTCTRDIYVTKKVQAEIPEIQYRS